MFQGMFCNNFGQDGKAPPKVDPEVLQSGCGVNLLIWSGELSENCPQFSQQISPANFSFFLGGGLVSPGLQALHTSNCRHSFPISHFEPDTFTPIFCLQGRPSMPNTGQFPRRTSLVPLAFSCFLHCSKGVETEGFFLSEKGAYRLTRNYYENNSPRVIFRNFRGKLHP